MTNFMGKTERHMEDSKVQVERLTETVIRSEPKTPRLPLLQMPGQETPNSKKRRYEESRSVFQQPSPVVQQQQKQQQQQLQQQQQQQQQQLWAWCAD